MRSSRLLLVSLLFACGDNDDGKTPRPDSMPPTPDVAIDAPPMLTCGHTEMADATNNALFNPNSAAPEATGITFSQPFMVCGKLDSTHYEQNTQIIDSDSYRFTVPAQSNAILYFTAPGAEAYDAVFLQIYGMQGSSVSETGEFAVNYAVTSAVLPPGDYTITVTAYDSTAPTAALDYQIKVLADPPNRCAKSTGTPNYTESIDGATADGNDVIEVRYVGQPRRQLTANPADVPEPSAVTVAAGSTYRISGENTRPTVPPVSWADSFQDRDTYLVTMGANTNQLSIRLNWPGTTADFDFFVFPENAIFDIARGWKAGDVEDEFVTLAVTPGASYRIWAGADDASTGQPITYDFTLCGDTYTP